MTQIKTMRRTPTIRPRRHNVPYDLYRPESIFLGPLLLLLSALLLLLSLLLQPRKPRFVPLQLLISFSLS